MRRQRKMVPRIAALTRKSRPGKEEADILQSQSKTGTKAKSVQLSKLRGFHKAGNNYLADRRQCS